MKKWFVISLVLLALGFTAGCGENEDSNSTNSTFTLQGSTS